MILIFFSFSPEVLGMKAEALSWIPRNPFPFSSGFTSNCVDVEEQGPDIFPGGWAQTIWLLWQASTFTCLATSFINLIVYLMPSGELNFLRQALRWSPFLERHYSLKIISRLTWKLAVFRWEALGASFYFFPSEDTWANPLCTNISPNCFCMSFWRDGHFLRKKSHKHYWQIEPIWKRIKMTTFQFCRGLMVPLSQMWKTGVLGDEPNRSQMLAQWSTSAGCLVGRPQGPPTTL